MKMDGFRVVPDFVDLMTELLLSPRKYFRWLLHATRKLPARGASMILNGQRQYTFPFN